MKLNLVITIMTLFSCKIILGQIDSNKTFLASKGTWRLPVSKGFILKSNFEDNGNKSIIFIADSATTVNTVFNGTVVLVTKYDDVYMIVIKYGNYFIGYSNLGGCTVKKGDKVKTGDVIAYVGKDIDERFGIDFVLSDGSNELDAISWFSQTASIKPYQ